MFGGLLLNAIVISIILTGIVTTVGILFYGVTFPGHWLALITSLAVGGACFCALGIAVACFIPNADAGPAIVNGILFPILFLSGIFFPVQDDSWLARLADIFPIRHFANAVFAAFNPRLPHGIGHGWRTSDLLVMGIWGVAGVVIALRKFRWEPSR
jgi:ABC-2 type transport system permease protein